MAAGPQAPAAHRGVRTAPTRPQGQGNCRTLRQPKRNETFRKHTRATVTVFLVENALCSVT
eukprot:1082026-Prorocentrum_minimum.AAC.1